MKQLRINLTIALFTIPFLVNAQSPPCSLRVFLAADEQVSEFQPANTGNDSPNIFMKNSPAPAGNVNTRQRAFIRWETGCVPQFANLLSADMFLFYDLTSANNPHAQVWDNEVDMIPLDPTGPGWIENNLSWNNQGGQALLTGALDVFQIPNTGFWGGTFQQMQTSDLHLTSGQLSHNGNGVTFMSWFQNQVINLAPADRLGAKLELHDESNQHPTSRRQTYASRHNGMTNPNLMPHLDLVFDNYASGNELDVNVSLSNQTPSLCEEIVATITICNTNGCECPIWGQSLDFNISPGGFALTGAPTPSQGTYTGGSGWDPGIIQFGDCATLTVTFTTSSTLGPFSIEAIPNTPTTFTSGNPIASGSTQQMQLNFLHSWNCSQGAITTTVTNGVGPFTYSVSNGGGGATNVGSSWTTASTLPYGTYTITVTDANGCSVSDVTTLGFPPIANNFAISESSCDANTCDGTIILGTTSGGLGPYDYEVKETAGSQSVIFSVTNTTLPSGYVIGNLCPDVNYTFTITDNFGCTVTFPIITFPDLGNWQQTSWLSSDDEANDVAIDQSGNVYVVGNFDQTSTFGSSSGTTISTTSIPGTYGAFVAKYDACGDLIWISHSILSTPGNYATGEALFLDEGNGKLYLTGEHFEFSGAGLVFTDQSGSTSTVLTNNGSGAYYAEFEMSTGQPTISADPFPHQGFSNGAQKLNSPSSIQLISGEMFIGGTVIDVQDDFQCTAFIYKVTGYTSSPANTVSFSGDRGTFCLDLIGESSKNEFYMVGKYIGSIDFGLLAAPGHFSAGGALEFDGFVAGFTPNGSGNLICTWLLPLNAIDGPAELNSIDYDGTSSLFISGYTVGGTMNSFTFGSGYPSVPPSLNSSTIVARLENNGTYAANSWMVHNSNLTINSSKSFGLDFYDGHVGITGTVNSGDIAYHETTSTGSGALLPPVVASVDPDVHFVSLFEENGTHLNSTLTEGIPYQQGNSIVLSNFFLHSVGKYEGTMSFTGTSAPIDGASPSTQKASILRNVDMSLYTGIPYKRGEAGTANSEEYDAGSFKIDPERNPFDFSVYPNPTSGDLTIRSDFETSYMLYNQMGQLLFEGKVGKGETQIFLSNYSSGVYLLKANTQEIKILKTN